MLVPGNTLKDFRSFSLKKRGLQMRQYILVGYWYPLLKRCMCLDAKTSQSYDVFHCWDLLTTISYVESICRRQEYSRRSIHFDFSALYSLCHLLRYWLQTKPAAVYGCCYPLYNCIAALSACAINRDEVTHIYWRIYFSIIDYTITLFAFEEPHNTSRVNTRLWSLSGRSETFTYIFSTKNCIKGWSNVL